MLCRFFGGVCSRSTGDRRRDTFLFNCSMIDNDDLRFGVGQLPNSQLKLLRKFRKGVKRKQGS